MALEADQVVTVAFLLERRADPETRQDVVRLRLQRSLC
jgi:hypothetical protein